MLLKFLNVNIPDYFLAGNVSRKSCFVLLAAGNYGILLIKYDQFLLYLTTKCILIYYLLKFKLTDYFAFYQK